jgi:hypothetical protein
MDTPYSQTSTKILSSLVLTNSDRPYTTVKTNDSVYDEDK